MRYLLSDSDNQLPSLPSVSPESRLSPGGTPPPASDHESSLQQVNSSVHSTLSTPEGQTTAKRVRTDASQSDHDSDDNPPSTSDAEAPPPATVQQTILLVFTLYTLSITFIKMHYPIVH